MSDEFSDKALNPDILIVGAGPAGIAAATAVRASGKSVTIVDDNPTPGGQIWRGAQRHNTDGQGETWLRRYERLSAPTINSARVISASAMDQTVLLETAERPLEIRFEKLILATGARELFLPFPGWTLPGVMGVGGIQAMAKSGLPIKGKKVVLAGSGPLLLAVASYFRKHGATVNLIAEQTPRSALAGFVGKLIPHPSKILQAIQLQSSLIGVPYLTDCWVERAEGQGRLQQVVLRKREKTRDKSWTETCDYAGIAYGLQPNTELAALVGCDIADQAIRVDEDQQTSASSIYAAGECTGIGGVDLAVIEGQIAGYSACGQRDHAARVQAQRKKALRFALALKQAFPLREELKQLPRPDTIVCRCEDVTFRQLENAGSFRSAKLHSRCAMGPCQGRICGPAAKFLFGWEADSIRPPIFPARIGSLLLESTTPKESSLTL